MKDEPRNLIYVFMRVFTKVKRLLFPLVLHRDGFILIPHLINIYFIIPVFMRILPIYLISYVEAKKLLQKFNINKQIHYWKMRKEEILKLGKKGYTLNMEKLGLEQEKLDRIKEIQQRANEVVIAEIDQDGFLLSYFGPIRNAITISKKEFLPRKRFKLEVVIINGQVGIKKHYNDDKLSFVNEIDALYNLGLAGRNVPAIMDIDFNNLTLTFSYILGSVLREELAKRGAVVYDRDVINNPEYIHLLQKKRWIEYIQKLKDVLIDLFGLHPEQKRWIWIKCSQKLKYVLSGVIGSHFMENLFAELKKVHATGFVLKDVKYGNIIIEKESGKPFFIDFDGSMNCSFLGKHFFKFIRDRDIEKFNMIFCTEMLTYKRIKEQITSKNVPHINNFYAPVYFGDGLRIGPIWSVDRGYGRWHFTLKHYLPLISGRRILDLGANNSFYALQLLRNGAEEVIGVELDSRFIAQGNYIKKVFEWADNTSYNFRYIQANMKEIPTMNLGNFDMVMALCSMYYLDDDSISSLIRYISTITDVFVLQCNIATDMDRIDPYVYTKASIEYAVKAIECNGFPVTQVIAPYGYSRPLVIGRKDK